MLISDYNSNIISALLFFSADVHKKIALGILLCIFHCIFVRRKLFDEVRKAVGVDELSI